ncbi:MAG TPA: acetate/propionate family kinase [Thermoanaerobaculia bacterium]|nr:acetate/propionate family kinase [Thermoanaerobaculia bacterium]
MTPALAVLNAGSSSLKFSVYRGDPPALVLRGQAEGFGTAPRFVVRDAAGVPLADEAVADSHVDAFRHLSAWLRGRYPGVSLSAVGHRVVHGGMHYAEPVLVDEAVLKRLESLVPLAPLHQPHNLSAIRAVREANPRLPQVACFDTAFHRRHAKVVERYALPGRYYREGIRRYGFHGLSYEYVAQAFREKAPDVASGRVVVAHLGSGASLCALEDGRSVDTTMGFSALDGLPMATRSGSVDPGVLLYLLREAGLSPGDLERLLYAESGLLGLSGLSGDMRTLLASDESEAREAIDYFVFRVHRELGALMAVLGGLDALVFTAGVGENSAEIRGRICRAAAWTGLVLDEAANRAGGPCISEAGTRPSAWVIPTDEEQMIARHTLTVLGR